MVDRYTAIQDAVEAIKRVSESNITISRFAISEIERLVAVIDHLTNSSDVKQEGEYLVTRAMGRYAERPAGVETASSVVWAARLHGAVARYEFALRRAGFLGVGEGESKHSPQAPRKQG